MSALDTFALKVTRPYREEDLPAMAEIWNEVVEDGVAFPQTEPLAADEAEQHRNESARHQAEKEREQRHIRFD